MLIWTIRAIESTFRSLNNLLERFHASAFLYLMTSVTSFITVGNYLAAPILLSASMTILGLSICAECFSNDVPEIEKILTGNSRVMEAFGVIGATHLIGGGIYFLTLKLNPLVPLSVRYRSSFKCSG